MALVADDDLAAARAADRVVRPGAARGHPHHVRAVVGGRGHQHVVAVGDHHRLRVRGQAGPQRAFDHVDLADPVQLVARQVEQDDDGGFDRVEDVRHVHLVDFQGRQPGPSVGGQRGDQTGVHVGALGVGGHRSHRAQRGRGHPGGGGLAVGAGDDDGAPARPELTQNRAVQRHRDQAADHRPGPASGDPRRPPRARPGGEGQTCAGGDHPGSLRAIASSALSPSAAGRPRRFKWRSQAQRCPPSAAGRHRRFKCRHDAQRPVMSV